LAAYGICTGGRLFSYSRARQNITPTNNRRVQTRRGIHHAQISFDCRGGIDSACRLVGQQCGGAKEDKATTEAPADAMQAKPDDSMSGDDGSMSDDESMSDEKPME